jgi:polyferredoxin
VSRRRKPKSGAAHWRRRIQLLSLAAFFALVLLARPVPGRTPSPVLHIFFDLDPLILLSTALAAHAVQFAALLALITVVLTLVLGRVFCGWFCPLGTLQAIAGRAVKPRNRRPERWSRWQLAKYFVLIGLLVMALFGVQWLTLFDPMVILYRTTTTALWPAVQWAVEDGSTAIYRSNPGFGPLRLTALTEPVYGFLRDHVFVRPQPAFLGSGLILAFFILILALSWYRRRFWCRYICPLGALLGLLSWRPWVRRKVDAAACNQCDVCSMSCHGAAVSAAGVQWRSQECLGCYNCTDACAQEGLKFEITPSWGPRNGARVPPSGRLAPELPAKDPELGISRRGLFGAAAAGLGGLVILRTTPQARGTVYNPELVRPPGARAERDFLSRCTGCGACMQICPTGGLQPTLTEAGLAGLWTPRLVPQIGYCDYECNRCGEVCPTQAIARLPLAQKQAVRIGLAYIDTNRCIPYALGRECAVCEEHCPVPHKAIYFVETEVVTPGGQRQTVKQPRVDAEHCTGCGTCENVCPFRDRPAIRVTSANEQRHPENQPILPGESGTGE